MTIYKELFRIPGAAGFSLAGIIARFPMSMSNLAIIMMISLMFSDYSLAGRLSAVGAVSFALAVPQISRYVDRYGQARIMYPCIIMSGIALFALVAAVLHRQPHWVLYVLTALTAALSGSVGALVRARWVYVLKDHEPGRLQSAFALEATFDEVIFIIGPLIATVLCTSIHPVAGIMAAGIISLVGSTLFFCQRITEPVPSKKLTEVPHNSGFLLANATMVVLMIVYSLMGAMFGALDVVTVAFAEESGWPGGTGVLLAALALGSLIAGVIYGSRTWVWSLPQLYILGVTVLCVGGACLLFATGFWTFAVLMFITGTAFAPTATNIMTMVSRAVPQTNLTEAIAWMSTAISIGSSVGAAVAGDLISRHQSFGGLVAVAVCCAVTLVAAVITLPFLSKTQANIILK
ncbi:MAG: MFS transporter [Actinomycetaceae bacterium]|nr:MFS transporter [Actinomycetaceae bacterium]